MKTYTIFWPPQLAMSYLGSGDLEHQNKETLSSTKYYSFLLEYCPHSGVIHPEKKWPA